MSAAPLAAIEEWSDSEQGSGCFSLAEVESTPPAGLRALALEADGTGAVPYELGRLWRSMLAGEVVVVDWFASPSRWLVLCAPSPQATGSKPVSARVSRLFESLFLGQSQKSAAFEHRVCNATISVTVHKALEHLGIECTPRRVPPILALLVRAGLGLATPNARYSTFVTHGGMCEVVSIERPELQLAHRLSPAEYHVLCRIVAGDTYSDIAAERRTSRRTVANQVSAVFRRLAVSGRAELVARVVELGAAAAPPNERSADANFSLAAP